MGTIAVDGLTVPLTLSAEAPYYYYVYEFGAEPPAGELFDSGDTLTASADGGDHVPFTVTAGGVIHIPKGSKRSVSTAKGKFARYATVRASRNLEDLLAKS